MLNRLKVTAFSLLIVVICFVLNLKPFWMVQSLSASAASMQSAPPRPPACPSPTPVTGGNVTVPAPSSQKAERFGVYHWPSSGDYSCNPCTPDRLNWIANQIDQQTSSRTIRVFFGPKDQYDFDNDGNYDEFRANGTVNTLTQVATETPYNTLFTNPNFTTYILTSYPYISGYPSRYDPNNPTGSDNAWLDGLSCAEYNETKRQYEDLASYLLSNSAFAGKTFILLDWESDHAFDGSFGIFSDRWEDFKNFVQAKAYGVRVARAAYPNSSVKVFSGLEYYLTYRNANANPRVPCDNNLNRCVMSTVAPFVDVDYYSYSSYQTVNMKFCSNAMFAQNNQLYCQSVSFPSNLKQELKHDLDIALNTINAGRASRGLSAITSSNFIVGEYGWLDTNNDFLSFTNPTESASILNDMFATGAIDGSGAFNPAYAIFWQGIDNANHHGQDYGLFTRNNNAVISPQLGATFNYWVQ